ncbi:MAG: metallophosphoesterase [Clostridia bacterium]|nr:metallophosphoesterase [Clostridia bacterium]
MLLRTLLQKAAYRIFALILSMIYASSGGAVPPSDAAPIAVSDPESVQMTFLALADPQISNYLYKRYPIFEAATTDIQRGKGVYDAVLIAGDIAENGFASEYQMVYDRLSGLDCRYINAVGNHDVRLRSYAQVCRRFAEFTNALNGDDAMQSLHYTERINGYQFIVLGTDRTEFEESYFSDAQLQWLDDSLAAENGKPVFVICHQPLKETHGLPQVWNSPIDSAGSVGAQSDQLRAILGKYQNVFFLTGHEHTGFGPFTYEEIDGFHSINLPSLCCNNADGDYNEDGQGYLVEVYADHVLFRARDLMRGLWLPDYDISIPIAD